MRARPERFGAWVALDDTTLLALDRRAAARIGIEGGTLWDDAVPAPPPAPLEAHVAVTSRCPLGCTGCYQGASPAGQDVPRDELLATLDALAAAGVFTVAFGGGEPVLRDDLGEIAQAARARGLTPVVTTSGAGLTPERARALRSFAQVNVSHDGVDGGYGAVRGFEGERVAERAIALLVAEGIPVGVNMVLTRQSFPLVEATAARVRSLGARELQLLRYKPAGRAASLEYLSRRLSPVQVRELYPLLAALTARHAGSLALRIDCALVPFLSLHVSDGRALERWGIFGCEAGRHLAAITRTGALSPCSFASSDAHERFAVHRAPDAWRDAPDLARFRLFADAPPEPCASCAIQRACRGGCKVVAEHLEGSFGPDPECPRVLSHRAAHDPGAALTGRDACAARSEP